MRPANKRKRKPVEVRTAEQAAIVRLLWRVEDLEQRNKAQLAKINAVVDAAAKRAIDHINVAVKATIQRAIARGVAKAETRLLQRDSERQAEARAKRKTEARERDIKTATEAAERLRYEAKPDGLHIDDVMIPWIFIHYADHVQPRHFDGKLLAVDSIPRPHSFSFESPLGNGEAVASYDDLKITLGETSLALPWELVNDASRACDAHDWLPRRNWNRNTRSRSRAIFTVHDEAGSGCIDPEDSHA